jgi:hypothetical protein
MKATAQKKNGPGAPKKEPTSLLSLRVPTVDKAKLLRKVPRGVFAKHGQALVKRLLKKYA